MLEYRLLKQYGHYLTKQEYKTLKGQIKSGDTHGFMRGLNNLLRKKGIRVGQYETL